MPHDSPIYDPADLLREVGWIRSLALRLVRDETRADDLTQDALVAALTHKPELRDGLRPWLRTVVQRLFLQELRKEKLQRSKREAIAKEAEVEGGLEAVERAHAHQDVVNQLMKMREPYRKTIILRYFEDLSPQQVADQLNLPLETIRTRLRRGLKELRSAMNKDWGGLECWVIPLLLIPGQSVATHSTTSIGTRTGGLSKSINFGLGVVSAFALLSWMTLTVWSTGSQLKQKEAISAVAEDSIEKDLLGADHDAGNIVHAQRIGATVSEDAPEKRTVSGRLIDPITGAGLQGIKLRFTEGAGPLTIPRPSPRDTRELVTDATGRFRFVVLNAKSTNYRCIAMHPDRVSLAIKWDEDTGLFPGDLGDILMPRGCRVKIRIVGDGTRYRVGDLFIANLTSKLDSRYRFVSNVWEDFIRRDGTLRSVRQLPGIYFLSAVQGYDGTPEKSTIVIPEGKDSFETEIRIVPEQGAGKCDGRVVFADGSPAKLQALSCRLVEGGETSDCLLYLLDGRFRVLRHPEWPKGDLRVQFHASCSNRDRWFWPGTYVLGKEPIMLTVPPLKTIHVLVKDSLSGQPIEKFGYRWQRGFLDENKQERVTQHDLRGALMPKTRHTNGHLKFQQHAFGTYLLQIVPFDGRHEVSNMLEYTVPDGQSFRVEVGLRRQQKQMIRVVDARGKLVQNCRIKPLRAIWGTRMPANYIEMTPNDFLSRIAMVPGRSIQTNEQGEGVIRLTLGETYYLRMESSDYAQIHGPFMIAGQDHTQVIRLSPQSGVRLRLPRNGLSYPQGVDVQVMVCKNQSSALRGGRSGGQELKLAAGYDGRMQPIESGPSWITLIVTAKAPVSVPWSMVRVIASDEELAPGKVITINLGKELPKLESLRLRLHLAQGSVQGKRLEFWARKTRGVGRWDRPVLSGEILVRKAGWIDVLLPPGGYYGTLKPSSRYGRSSELPSAWCVKELEVRASSVGAPALGQKRRSSVIWKFKSGVFRVKLVGATSGAPLKQARFKMLLREKRSAGSYRIGWLTDDKGECVLKGLPFAPLYVTVTNWPKFKLSGLPETSSTFGQEMKLGVVTLREGATNVIRVPGL